MVETTLRAALIADPTFAALCGARVYAELMPQNARLPAVVYSRIWTDRDSAMGADTGLVSARIQWSCFAESGAGVAGFDAVEAVAAALRGVLQRYRAGAIQDTFIENETTTYESDSTRHGRVIDTLVHFTE